MVTLETLPTEVVVQIFSHLTQDLLHTLVTISPALSEVAAVFLYRCPKFRSTYRFAQFVTTVSHSSTYANMVRVFELPAYLKDEIGADKYARWIEWKYRTVDLYAAKRVPYKPGWSIHPTCNPFLNREIGTVPIGALLHVLTACVNLRLRCPFSQCKMFGMLTIPREVALGVNFFEKDYIIKSSAYIPTALSSMIFVSDVTRSWTHNSTEIELITSDFIIRQLPLLQYLHKIDICDASWLTTENVETILSGCPNLKDINFLGSGNSMATIPWAIRGSRMEIAEKLRVALKLKA